MKIADEVRKKLELGVIHRAGQLYLFFSVGFLIFGFYTYKFLQETEPSLTLYGNVLPRVLVSSLPCLLLGIYLKKKNDKNLKLKKVISLTLFPAILALTASYKIWPNILAGNERLYVAIHATNIYTVSLWFLYLAPSLKSSLKMAAAFMTFFIVPLGYILFVTPKTHWLFNLACNDFLLSMAVNFYCGYSIHRLKRKLAEEDVENKYRAEKFLGRRVTQSIFENNPSLLEGKQFTGVIVASDLRGFTNYVNNTDEKEVLLFLDLFHKAVADAAFKNGGFIHKSNGDGHLVSFGVMDDEETLMEVPMMNLELKVADKSLSAAYCSRAHSFAKDLTLALNKICTKLPSAAKLKIGIGIDVGPVELRLIGNQTSKEELDIHGSVIAKASRIEELTKLLFKDHPELFSIILMTTEVTSKLRSKHFEEISLTGKLALRNFPQVKMLKATFIGGDNQKRRAA